MLSYQQTKKNDLGQNIGVEVDAFDLKPFQAKNLNGYWGKLIPVDQIESDSHLIRHLLRTVKSDAQKGAFTYLPYSDFNSGDELETALKSNFGFIGAKHYVIQVGHQFLGWIALLNFRKEHKVVEIGNIYFSEHLQKTTSATEMIYLLLNECFELGFRKVEWKCDDLNEGSINAAVRLGFLYEGTLRQDRINKGRNRNTAYFSMLDEEWPKYKYALEQWLKPDNFNLARQQKNRLKYFIELYK